MQIQVFKVFRDLAETGSFSKAADASGVTQSAVSQQVRMVEERFGVKLLERGGRRFTLTPEGEAFLEASRDILGAYDGLGERFRRIRNVVAGELRIASILSIGLHELPPCLQEFRALYPGVKVMVDYRRSAQVVAAVLGGEADVGLVACPGSRRGVEVRTFWKDRLVLICPPGHSLARRRKVRFRQLEGAGFIAFEPDLPTRKMIDRRLKQSGVRVRHLMEFDSIETVKRTVAVEQAVSIVPETAVRAEAEAGTLVAVPIDEPAMWRPLGALTRRAANHGPALREFLAMLQKFDLGGERKKNFSLRKVPQNP